MQTNTCNPCTVTNYNTGLHTRCRQYPPLPTARPGDDQYKLLRSSPSDLFDDPQSYCDNHLDLKYYPAHTPQKRCRPLATRHSLQSEACATQFASSDTAN